MQNHLTEVLIALHGAELPPMPVTTNVDFEHFKLHVLRTVLPDLQPWQRSVLNFRCPAPPG